MRAVVSRRLGLAIAAAAIVGLSGATILARPAAAAEPAVTVVVKIAGIPWFNALSKGVEHGGKDFALDATMIGPANVDPAQQVKLVEDLIAKKVAVIGLVPLDVKVMEPVLKRAQEAGIPVITHEGPEQVGKTWNVELIDSIKFGEVQMQPVHLVQSEQVDDGCSQVAGQQGAGADVDGNRNVQTAIQPMCRVGDGVREGVGVGPPCQARCSGDAHSAQDQLPGGVEGVDVEAHPHPHVQPASSVRARSAARSARHSSMSPGRVIFTLRALPATTLTR